MDERFRIAYTDKPEQDDIGVIGGGLRDFNTEHAGDDNYHGLYLFLYDAEDQVVGGVIGTTYWDWFFLNVIWVKEELRRQGHGHRLLEAAEEEARQRGVKAVYLDTFSFQAPEFYQKHGYEVFGELADFPAGHQRTFFQKQL